MTRPKLSLLLVEDNPFDVKLACLAFRELPFEISHTHVRDGVEALAALESSEKPDAVLLDLNLPRLDGFEVLRRLEDQGVDVPVFVLSTSRRNEDVQRAHDLGARAYIVKELDFRRFAAALEDALAGLMR